jgi:4a-hydroxytetrahydrobiopterin dehydratase
MTPLAKRTCVELPRGTPALQPAEIHVLLGQVHGWTVEDGKLVRSWKFPDFLTALTFVNKVANIAEDQQHHPDIAFGWGHARVELATHSIGGLSLNDFIIAARVEAAT